MKKVYVSWSDVEHQVQEILRQMFQDQWMPDYVVGITRGGLVPANLISQYTGCKMETLHVQLRDGGESGCESNLWMAEDAYNGKNILVVDDINDSGATLNWIMRDWPSGCYPEDERWVDSIWNNNVRIAVLVDNQASQSQLPVNYSAIEIDKSAEPQWIVFPWEEWWKH